MVKKIVKVIDYSIQNVNNYRIRDNIADENLGSFTINVGNSDSCDSEDFVHVQNLNSEFGYNELHKTTEYKY